MKCFVSGGAGFIGSTLVEHLLRDSSNNVTVYDNYSSTSMDFLARWRADSRLQVIKSDLLNSEHLSAALEGHDCVYHLASNPDISRGIDDPSVDYKQSIAATFNLLQAMRTSKVRRLLFTSGSGIYGDTNGLPTDESYGPLLPISMYGAGKLGAEALISAFADMFGFQTFIFRMANVVGRRQTHGVILDFINRLKTDASELQIRGDGKQSKSYIHVDDVIDCFDFVMTKTDQAVNVFNVATEDFVSVDEIAKVVIEEMQLPWPEIQYSGGSRGWKGDVPVVRINCAKLAALGFRPRLNSMQAVRKATREILEFQEQMGQTP
jgi:UDP-glucose 4-epimerase